MFCKKLALGSTFWQGHHSKKVTKQIGATQGLEILVSDSDPMNLIIKGTQSYPKGILEVV